MNNTSGFWLLCMLLFCPAAIAQPCGRPPDPNVRALAPGLGAALADGVRRSPTLRALVEALDRSDVVVYLALGPQERGVGAHVSFVSAAGGRRYLRVSVDPRLRGCGLTAILGHELQHALEIASAPSVVDARSLGALYAGIGFRTGDVQVDRFDSRQAVDTGRRIERELLAENP